MCGEIKQICLIFTFYSNENKIKWLICHFSHIALVNKI